MHAQKTGNNISRPNFPSDIKTINWLFLGADGMSLYLDAETKDPRGELEEPGFKGTEEDTVHFSEIRASACLGVSLLEALNIATQAPHGILQTAIPCHPACTSIER